MNGLRVWIALARIALPTVMYGGYSLLSGSRSLRILRRVQSYPDSGPADACFWVFLPCARMTGFGRSETYSVPIITSGIAQRSHRRSSGHRDCPAPIEHQQGLLGGPQVHEHDAVRPS
jgi:hypothetical protein